SEKCKAYCGDCCDTESGHLRLIISEHVLLKLPMLDFGCMRFATFEHNGHRHAGVVLNDQVVSLKTAGYPDALSVLQGGPEALKKVAAFAANGKPAFPLASVKLCAPIPVPPKILCMGLNYRDHAEEARLEIPKYPVIFAKYTNTVIGSGDNIVLPRNSR